MLSRRSLIRSAGLVAPALILPKPLRAQIGAPPLVFPGALTLAKVTHSFTASASAAAFNPNPWNAGTLSLGTPAVNRYIVLAFAGLTGGSGVITAVTVAGVSCNQVGSLGSSGTARAAIFITSAPVPTGATGAVSISATGGASSWNMGIGVYALYVPSSAVLSNPVTGVNGGNPESVTLAIPALSVAIAASFNSGGGTAAWTNLTKDVQLSFTTPQASMASTEFSAGASTTLTCNWSNGNSQVMAVAAWGIH
jgi:hypothetical protein